MLTRKERFRLVLEYFARHNPEAETELEYESAFQLLVAVILSAQCTDKRVNQTTPSLFAKFPDAQSLAAAGEKELLPYIKGITYPNSKTRHLIKMSAMLLNEFGGEVPADVNQLIRLPGVGRKTANVIASCIFNQPAMAVDTHVFRVSVRIGLTVRAKNPYQAELQLLRFIPREQVSVAHHWLILHGRYVCLARTPRCTQCPFTQWCLYFEKENKKATRKKS